MKTLLFLLVAVLAVALVSGERHWPKRHQCKSDADCEEGHCCVRGKFLSHCYRIYRKGDICGVVSWLGQRVPSPKLCGCEGNLVCKRRGIRFKICTDEEGNGIEDDFLDY